MSGDCGGCPPWVPCPTFMPGESYSDGDQDDTHSWRGQKDYFSGVTSWSAGFGAAPLDKLIDYVQKPGSSGGTDTRTFYSVPIPAGAIEARVYGTVRAKAVGGTSLAGTHAWELVRADWGGSAPVSIDPGGVVLASGAMTFPSDPAPPNQEAFDTGRFSVGGANFQLYLKFVTPPLITGTDAQFLLRNGSFYGDPDTWAIEFYDCTSAPRSNQRVFSEIVGVGDGVTTAFATDFPYLLGTLIVTVAGFVYEIDTSSPSTGGFNLPDPPPVGATIVANYRAGV